LRNLLFVRQHGREAGWSAGCPRSSGRFYSRPPNFVTAPNSATLGPLALLTFGAIFIARQRTTVIWDGRRTKSRIALWGSGRISADDTVRPRVLAVVRTLVRRCGTPGWRPILPLRRANGPLIGNPSCVLITEAGYDADFILPCNNGERRVLQPQFGAAGCRGGARSPNFRSGGTQRGLGRWGRTGGYRRLRRVTRTQLARASACRVPNPARTDRSVSANWGRA
jgi:hypothetical protein